jgi:integrase
MLASALSCSFPTCPARRVSEGYQIMANCIRLDWPQWMRPPRDLGRAEQPLPYQGVGKQSVTQEPNAGVRFLPLNRHGLARRNWRGRHRIEWKPVQTYDLPQTADVIEAFRGRKLFIPVLLASLCGLRRGEICALRWKNVDLAGAQLSVVESLEQTKAGLRFKSPKSGKGRTVALPPTVVDELRSYRARRAQEALRLGAGL